MFSNVCLNQAYHMKLKFCGQVNMAISYVVKCPNMLSLKIKHDDSRHFVKNTSQHLRISWKIFWLHIMEILSVTYARYYFQL